MWYYYIHKFSFRLDNIINCKCCSIYGLRTCWIFPIWTNSIDDFRVAECWYYKTCLMLQSSRNSSPLNIFAISNDIFTAAFYYLVVVKKKLKHKIEILMPRRWVYLYINIHICEKVNKMHNQFTNLLTIL